MGVTLAFHSYKGGTGKTLISANIAAILARRGKRVCLIDYDLHSPSQFTLLKNYIAHGIKPQQFVNNLLKGECEVEEALLEVDVGATDGTLVAAFGNESTEAEKFMATRDRNWEGKAFGRLTDAKNRLLKKHKMDYVILDTHPGVVYASLNAVATSDVVTLVTRKDEDDMKGTQKLITEIADEFDTRSTIILNRVVCEGCGGALPLNESSRVSAEILKRLGRPIIGVIPCLWQLQLAGSQELYAVTQPTHPFVNALQQTADEIGRLSHT